MIGYFLPKFNWAVEFYKGEWICRSIQFGDIVATTEEQLAAIRYWKNANIRKYLEAKNSPK